MITWDFAALQEAPRVFEAPAAYIDALPQTEPLPEGIRAFTFEGFPFKGKPTRVFALYGAPAWASPSQKSPGIVLVHGAGGTAFASWVKTWVDRGYAAIAFDNEGQLPVGKYDAWARNPQGGPRRADIAQLDWPITDQWMYHAVADTMLAHSLLTSLPEVDADRIGTTGISWGAVVLANVAAVDSRLKFAVPVYGCGFISEASADGSTFVGGKATPEQRAAWRALWDPSVRLSEAKMPMLWLTGTNDFAFTLRAWQRSYRTAPGIRGVCVRVRMVHGHGAAGENPEEIRAFADSIVNGGKPLARVVRQSPEQGDQNGRVWVEWTTDAELPIHKAQINFTRTAEGPWQDRLWETAPAEIDASGHSASATLPADAAVYYFNLIDVRGLIVSSEHELRK
jgi:dienelactone hydrolase